MRRHTHAFDSAGAAVCNLLFSGACALAEATWESIGTRAISIISLLNFARFLLYAQWRNNLHRDTRESLYSAEKTAAAANSFQRAIKNFSSGGSIKAAKEITSERNFPPRTKRETISSRLSADAYNNWHQRYYGNCIFGQRTWASVWDMARRDAKLCVVIGRSGGGGVFLFFHAFIFVNYEPPRTRGGPCFLLLNIWWRCKTFYSLRVQPRVVNHTYCLLHLSRYTDIFIQWHLSALAFRINDPLLHLIWRREWKRENI